MKKFFITGLFLLLPLTITLIVLFFLINLLTEPFIGFVEGLFTYYHVPLPKHFLFLTTEQTIHLLSQLLILITLFLFTLLLGFLAHLFFFHALIKFSDALMARIPFVNKVYKACQEIIRALIHSPKEAFKQVVMVPFPSKQAYGLGLLVGSNPVQSPIKDDLLAVFVPTTPNPTSGYLLMFPREEVIFVDMKVQEAIKYIVSCGVVTGNPPAEQQGESS